MVLKRTGARYAPPCSSAPTRIAERARRSEAGKGLELASAMRWPVDTASKGATEQALKIRN